MAVQDIKAVIFDCFGVLYTDSKQSLLDVVAPDRRQELYDLFRANNYGLYGRTAYLEQVADIVGKSVEEVSDYIAHEHHLNRTLVTYISEQLKGKYKIGMLSNIGREWIDSFFSEHELHELFDEVVLSGEEGIVKPNPEIFELAAERLGVAPAECLMIDDIAENCDGAIQAGMAGIQFIDNAQALSELERLLGKNDI
jgi:putative hydrolase of the HAD superfamily